MTSVAEDAGQGIFRTTTTASCCARSSKPHDLDVASHECVVCTNAPHELLVGVLWLDTTPVDEEGRVAAWQQLLDVTRHHHFGFWIWLAERAQGYARVLPRRDLYIHGRRGRYPYGRNNKMERGSLEFD